MRNWHERVALLGLPLSLVVAVAMGAANAPQQVGLQPMTAEELENAWGGSPDCRVVGQLCLGTLTTPANTCPAQAQGGTCPGNIYVTTATPANNQFCYNQSNKGCTTGANAACSAYQTWSCIPNAGGACVQSLLLGTTTRGVRTTAAGPTC